MNIEDALKTHIQSELISDKSIAVDLDTSLMGIVDSSGVLELAMWIESTFSMAVDFDEITPDDFGTIRRLAAWIRRSADRAKAV